MKESYFRASVTVAAIAAVVIVQVALLVLYGVTRVALVQLCLSCASSAFAVACARSVDGARSERTLFGMPVAVLGAVCLVAQLVTNVASVAVGPASEPIAYVVSAAILIAGVALVVTTRSALRHAEAVEQDQASRTAHMDGIRRRLLALQARSAGELAAAIASLEAEVRLASPISDERTWEIDDLIDQGLERLGAVVADPAAHGPGEGRACCEELSRLVRLRDRAARS